ncbi:MAG TPA: hypothetical protein VLX59_13940, partial [Acidimicrobiales bacterium]|nr:hypothetical protein [Acidimicrobiales bacterium]
GRDRVQTTRTAGRPPLSIRPSVHAILGLIWAGLFLAAVTNSAATAVALLVPVAVVASVSAVRVITNEWGGDGVRSTRRRTLVNGLHSGLAAAVPVFLALVALAGAAPAVVTTALAALGVGAVLFATSPGAPLAFALRSTVGILGPSVAAVAVVLARHQGSNEAVALVAAICCYDAAAFIFGTGRGALGGISGVVAGLVAVGVAAVLTAAALDPPFSGTRPCIVFGLVGVLAPVGVALLSLAVGGARLPALRRLDSLVLSGPAWVIAMAVVLHR